MKIICAGLYKTGTKSIAKALRQLGFTVYDWKEQTFDFLDHWCDVLQNGAQPDVKRVYQNADAFVDLPGNLFWEEILEAFPDCKVILSERDKYSWLQSWVNQMKMYESNRFQTILRAMLSQTAKKFLVIVYSCVQASLGSMNPKSTCVFRKRYRMHNYRVKSIVLPEKLLVYNVKQGWKPLCDFLGCEVPKSAFPHENIKGEIATRMKETTICRRVNWEVQRVIFVLLSLIVVITAASLVICFCR